MDAQKALDALKDVIVEAAKESPLGFAPSGVIYAALMQYISLETYTRVLALLAAEGKIRYTSERVYAL